MNTDHHHRRPLGDRAVTAIGWWTPELVCAAAGAIAASWWGPWLWAIPAALAVRIAADPLIRRARARRAGTRTAGPERARLTGTTHPHHHHGTDSADRRGRGEQRRTG